MKRRPVANKQELLTLLKDNSEQLRSYGVDKMSLFGSFVRNEGIHKKSDVDFFVSIREEKRTMEDFCGLGDFLEDLLGRKVELCQHYKLSPFILPHVLKEVEDVKLEEVPAI